ncbi:spore germination lipoprotein GerD [Aeribacillus sp. FSL K6-8394]|uniref:spore germination lipoprotein GerD n=1 Tax=Aeribacillus sp. FSL K6-8394 TaxID=2954570 RepID=UPI0030FA2765
MRGRNCSLLIMMLIWMIVAGCTDRQQSEPMNYDETKKMVVDILKSDEGKKAVQEIMKDEEVQRNLILDQKTVNNTIEKTLTSEKGKEFWKNTFEDTKFAEGFAKTLQTEHEKVIKRLMKDPEYQGMLMDVLKNPQMEEELLKVLKSKEYRQYLQQQITDVLSSPLFQPKIEEALLKAAQQAQSKQQGGGSSGNEGGGGGQ